MAILGIEGGVTASPTPAEQAAALRRLADYIESRQPHVHQFTTGGGAWSCKCGATKPRLIGPGV